MQQRKNELNPDGQPVAGSYRQVLRALGSYLNLQGARYLWLEVGTDGFIWQFAPRADRSHPERGESTVEDLLALDASYGQTLRGQRRRQLFGKPPTSLPLRWHPLVPEGYDRALGALGAWLDQYELRLLRLDEDEVDLQVWYDHEPGGHEIRGTLHRGRGAQIASYGRDDLVDLQRAAQGRRAHATRA
jgi:hypothetical protein